MIATLVQSFEPRPRGDALRYDVRITLLAAGLIFLLALVLGVWKYRQVLASPDHRARAASTRAHR